MPKKTTAQELRRLEALGNRLHEAVSATHRTQVADAGSSDHEVSTGELMEGMIFAALAAVIPGRQKRKQIDAENDAAVKAALRFLARRIEKPNPHGF